MSDFPRADRQGVQAHQAVRRVVHELDSVCVGLDLHDADDRAETFFHHDVHLVRDVDEDLRANKGGVHLGSRKVRLVDQALCTLRNCVTA